MAMYFISITQKMSNLKKAIDANAEKRGFSS